MTFWHAIAIFLEEPFKSPLQKLAFDAHKVTDTVGLDHSSSTTNFYGFWF